MNVTPMFKAAAVAWMAYSTACGNNKKDSTRKTVVRGNGALVDVKIIIEHNTTDEDTGFQGFVDGDPWNDLVLQRRNQNILRVTASGGLAGFGLTELFFETSEPPNNEVPRENVLSLLAEGTYTATGALVEGGVSKVSTKLTHDIPRGPTLSRPTDGETGVDAANTVIAWTPVSQLVDGKPVHIVGYQVIIEKDEEPAFPQTFAKAALSIFLPASVTSVIIPEAFMAANACYKFEVLAIEESGNQSISSARFSTGGACEVDEPANDATPKLVEAKLLIEHNATDEDTGFQGFADGEPWNKLEISGPTGKKIVTVDPLDGLQGFGLTELFFETSEPANDAVPIAEVLARLPEGNYTFTADMAGGGKSSIRATLTHDIPAGPVITSPTDKATAINPANLTVAWEPVTKDINGSPINIVGYQVIVVKDEEPQFPQGFAHPEFSVFFPANATQVTVPRGFLEAGSDYAVEVLAIEKSGNQTLSTVSFATR